MFSTSVCIVHVKRDTAVTVQIPPNIYQRLLDEVILWNKQRHIATLRQLIISESRLFSVNMPQWVSKLSQNQPASDRFWVQLWYLVARLLDCRCVADGFIPEPTLSMTYNGEPLGNIRHEEPERRLMTSETHPSFKYQVFRAVAMTAGRLQMEADASRRPLKCTATVESTGAKVETGIRPVLRSKWRHWYMIVLSFIKYSVVWLVPVMVGRLIYAKPAPYLLSIGSMWKYSSEISTKLHKLSSKTMPLVKSPKEMLL